MNDELGFVTQNTILPIRQTALPNCPVLSCHAAQERVLSIYLKIITGEVVEYDSADAVCVN